MSVLLEDNIGIYWIESILIAVIGTVVIAGLTLRVYRLNKDKWESFWDFLEKHLLGAFVIVWLFGFSVYLVGSIIKEENASFLCLLLQSPMACVHAFEMFILESDVSAVHDEFHNNLLFMSCFSLAHFLAAAISMMFIIKYFGFNLAARLRLFHATRIKGRFDELYVFWGLNEATFCLAKNIQKAYTEGKISGSYEIIIINTADDNKYTKKKHTSIERLFRFLPFGKEELNKYKELECLSANVFNHLSKIRVAENDEKMDVLNKVGASFLVKLIGKSDRNIHIFFLGQEEEENIIGTTMLCRDSTIDTFSKESHKVHIYCHARYDNINQIIEDRYSTDNIEVKVLDSSHDSINILKSKEEYHPINFVTIDTEDNIGTVTSGFTSLVIGFGETGRDAVRYLYEYGAFVDCRSVKEDDDPSMARSDIQKHYIMRSPFHCYVVDRDADKLSGQFFANAPAQRNISAWNTDILSSEFYSKLKNISSELNYVVIALGDDELNITTAGRLFNFVRMHRSEDSMKKIKIFVRCHNHEQEKHLQHIADHYNESGCKDVTDKYIEIFGTENQLYTYEQVIENDFEDEGRQYNAMYCEASKDSGRNNWETRHNRLLKTKTINALSELRRKESQDIANAYHALTKLHIMKKVAENSDGSIRPEMQHIHDCIDNKSSAPVFPERSKDVSDNVTGIISAEGNFTSQEQLLLRNLARLEHLRWNAAHEVMGYQSYADGDPDCQLVKDEGDNRHCCNETFKLHNCLIDWQNLDAETNDVKNVYHPDYKRYDFIVITATLKLLNKRQSKKK